MRRPPREASLVWGQRWPQGGRIIQKPGDSVVEGGEFRADADLSGYLHQGGPTIGLSSLTAGLYDAQRHPKTVTFIQFPPGRGLPP